MELNCEWITRISTVYYINRCAVWAAHESGAGGRANERKCWPMPFIWPIYASIVLGRFHSVFRLFDLWLKPHSNVAGVCVCVRKERKQLSERTMRNSATISEYQVAWTFCFFLSIRLITIGCDAIRQQNGCEGAVVCVSARSPSNANIAYHGNIFLSFPDGNWILLPVFIRRRDALRVHSPYRSAFSAKMIFALSKMFHFLFGALRLYRFRLFRMFVFCFLCVCVRLWFFHFLSLSSHFLLAHYPTSAPGPLRTHCRGIRWHSNELAI